MSSNVRRDLPTPGSPTTAATWPRPCRDLLDGAEELLDLGVPADERREPARNGGVKPRAHGADPGSS